MSDSEEDWFNKDEDEIVRSIQKKSDDVSEVEYIKCVANNHPTYDYASSNTSSSSIIPYKKLNLVANMDPLESFLEANVNNFLQCLSGTTRLDAIVAIVTIFSNIASLQLPEYTVEYLTAFVENERLNHDLVNLTKKLFSPLHSKTWKEKKIDVQRVANDVICIFEAIFEYGLQNDMFKQLLEQTSLALDGAKDDKRFALVNEKILHLKNNIDKPLCENAELDTELLPTLDDLKSDKAVMLKPNIVNGRYSSIAEYLGIQKNLLREDFIAPLRNAVQSLEDLQDAENLSDVKLYKNVKILSNDVVNVSKSEMLLVDVFASAKDNYDAMAFARLADELKYVICGSLVCFSTNQRFDNLILAVVSNSHPTTLSQGYINIEIINQHNVGRLCNVELQMLVCPVFFEPYNNAFNVLNTYNENNFPMANYIVYADNKQKPPLYLVNNPTPTYVYKKSSFNPLVLGTYPGTVREDMTGAQVKAFHLALSSEFSLILGPPGTGKTEISSKIAATLLTNTTLPIVVIAYTNEALDKFLLRILPYTDSIVRLGHQSKTEDLNKFNIKEIFNTIRGDNRCKRLNYITKLEYTEKFEALQKLQINFDGTDEEYHKIIAAQKELNKISKKLECIKMISTYLAVKEKRVIALTTTCAAKHNLMFKFLKDSIVLFEEAAEVLESHILSSITKYTQQVILVGDHHQLRPQTSVYKMSREYKMNISLFERMVNNNINVVCLNTQYRMRKEIADLIRPMIYKDLDDGSNVLTYPDIRGMKSNMFFVTHQHKENSTNALEISKFNDFEKSWMCDVASYLLKQNYRRSDIVMLAAYIKQKDRLSSHISRNCPDLQGIQVSTIDSFQGREANIVLLSLVRSNKKHQIGYLRESNRICVALSRAKMGLYVVGNMTLLAECSEMWDEVRKKFELFGAIGDKLPISSS